MKTQLRQQWRLSWKRTCRRHMYHGGGIWRKNFLKQIFLGKSFLGKRFTMESRWEKWWYCKRIRNKSGGPESRIRSMSAAGCRVRSMHQSSSLQRCMIRLWKKSASPVPPFSRCIRWCWRMRITSMRFTISYERKWSTQSMRWQSRATTLQRCLPVWRMSICRRVRRMWRTFPRAWCGTCQDRAVWISLRWSLRLLSRTI